MSGGHKQAVAAFAGTSEMHARVNAHDWASTPIGWPGSLRATVKTLLASRYPMVVLWGRELIQIYNEAYIGLIGEKHPDALGRSIRDTQAESWDTIGPMIQQVIATGVSNWVPAQRLLLERAGYREESWFSLSYSAVDDDAGRISGMLCVCSEVTQQVLSERRLRLLRELAAPTGPSRGVDATCRALVSSIAAQALDVPFALLYLGDESGESLVLRGAAGLAEGSPLRPASLGRADVAASLGSVPWPLARALDGERVVVEGLERFAQVRGGPFGDLVTRALVLPLAAATEANVPDGVLIAAVSPNRELDEGYRSFFELLAGQVSVALSTARAIELERRRAEALAELDRARTAFFSNVSHELRTPLTGIIGYADLLGSDVWGPTTEDQRIHIARMKASAWHLVSIIDEILTFSRVDARKEGVNPMRMDIARVVEECAELLRPEATAKGLELKVIPSIGITIVESDLVKIRQVLLNLIGNAVKFTDSGGVEVSVEGAEEAVHIRVSDTGPGIPPAKLDEIFEAFVQGDQSSTRVKGGVGLGLAVSKGLADLLGATVRVESTPGAGSTFSLIVPKRHFSSLDGDGWIS